MMVYYFTLYDTVSIRCTEYPASRWKRVKNSGSISEFVVQTLLEVSREGGRIREEIVKIRTVSSFVQEMRNPIHREFPRLTPVPWINLPLTTFRIVESGRDNCKRYADNRVTFSIIVECEVISEWNRETRKVE